MQIYLKGLQIEVQKRMAIQSVSLMVGVLTNHVIAIFVSVGADTNR